jgi:hypothetical protein
MSAIPKDVALKLCAKIRRENRRRWYTFNGLWCWGCSTFTKGDPSKMCLGSRPDCRGCAQVNRRYEEHSRPDGTVSRFLLVTFSGRGHRCLLYSYSQRLY